MSENVVIDLLPLALFISSILISLRTFYLCFQSPRQSNYRLFILGFAMGMFSLTALADYTHETLQPLVSNVGWFTSIGQAVSFLFIALSLINGSQLYLRALLRWQIIFFVLLLLLLTPLLPGVFPYPVVTKMILGALRFLLCLGIFIAYIAIFIRKEHRPSLFFSLPFFVLSIGYLLNMALYLDPKLILLNTIGAGAQGTGILMLLITLLLV